MKKILLLALLTTSMNAFALQIRNSDGSTSYVTKDLSGSPVITHPDGSSSYVSKDPSGATRIDHNNDQSTTYITDDLYRMDN